MLMLFLVACAATDPPGEADWPERFETEACAARAWCALDQGWPVPECDLGLSFAADYSACTFDAEAATACLDCATDLDPATCATDVAACVACLQTYTCPWEPR